jgi:hypothetical protein
MAATPQTLIYFDPRFRAGQLVAESKLTQEWLASRYPGAQIVGRIRLGPTSRSVPGRDLTPAMQAMLSVENWYPDALILDPGELLIVEAKVNPKPAAIGEVLFYQRLIYRTPELQPYMPRAFQPVVLFAEDDRDVSDFARSLGVRVEIYAPEWIGGYILTRQYRGRASRSGKVQSPE